MSGRIHVVWVAALLGLCVLPAPAGAAGQSGYVRFWCRTSEEVDYDVYKSCIVYATTTDATCYQGQPWCTKTVHNGVKLKHTHFTQNFTTAEKADADRYIEWYEAEPSPSTRYMSATTTFNCHAYALGPNTTVWNEDQVLTLGNDFYKINPPQTPIQVNDVVKHYSNHSSKIVQVSPSVLVMSKWGGYGKYRTSQSIYGGPYTYHRPL